LGQNQLGLTPGGYPQRLLKIHARECRVFVGVIMISSLDGTPIFEGGRRPVWIVHVCAQRSMVDAFVAAGGNFFDTGALLL
jgi:hypothetical protein